MTGGLAGWTGVSARAMVVATVLLLSLGAHIAAAREFGVVGSTAGAFDEPRGLAASAANGDLYVMDRNNERVDAFEGASGRFLRAWGWGVAEAPAAPQKQELQACTTQCFAGLSGGGAGELGLNPRGIAVDNSGLSQLTADASYGDVYVADEGNNRFEKFSGEGAFIYAVGREVNASKVALREAQQAAKEPVTVTVHEEDLCTGSTESECRGATPGTAEDAFEFAQEGEPIAVGPAGIVYVGDLGRVQEFAEDGTEVRAPALPGQASDHVTGIAVDAGGDLYVLAENVAGVTKYEETAPGTLTKVQTLDASGKPLAVALGPEGHVFVEDDAAFVHHIYEYDGTGRQIEAFDRGSEERIETFGIAWSEAGELYVGGRRGIRAITPPKLGPLVIEQSATPTPDGAVAFAATVNPEGADTTVVFEYEEDPIGKPGVFARTAPVTIPGNVGGQPNFSDEAGISAAVKGLRADTVYRFRVATENANGATEAAGSFRTLPAALVDSQSAVDVTADSATLQAEVNPLELPASYRFEYRPAGATTFAQTPEGQIAASGEDVAVTAHISNLDPNATYVYRVAVENALASGESVIFGSEQEFTTQHTAHPVAPLDGRGWEMVSPAHKQNASIESITPEGGLSEAAPGGGAMAYVATASIEPTPPAEPTPEAVQIVAFHQPTGWSSRDLASPHEQEWGISPGLVGEYPAFSTDLTAGLVEPHGQTLLGGATERTPYLRREALCEARPPAPECYTPLLTAADVTSKEKWGGIASLPTSAARVVAATPALDHVLLQSAVPLTAGDTEKGMYEWSEGRLQLASVMQAEAGGPRTQAQCVELIENERGEVERHRLSIDGDRSIWGAGCTERHIYMREVAGDRTVQLDVPRPGAGAGTAAPNFEDASVDASIVFFSDTQRLTTDSNADAAVGKADLYAYEANPDGAAEAGSLADLTVPINAEESAAVQGTITGASEDGTVVYAVARGVLTTTPNGRGEAATAGGYNLYRIERAPGSGRGSWTPVFVAGLSADDAPDWAGGGENGLTGLTARVSPNGRWLAFMSDRPLTGYDNRDAVSGARDEEVYLYSAEANRLVCASCDPTGARPHGQQIFNLNRKPIVDNDEIWAARQAWVSALVPGWDAVFKGVGVYQSRYLSDSGRLFFDSASPLVPQDVNHAMDVYEYEPPAGAGELGSDNCTAAAETYSAAADGCIALVSSGTVPQESAFLDASESGDDVFFVTVAKLVPRDGDDGYDVYDAHVCGIGWECPAAEGAPSSPCESASSCRPPGTPFATSALTPDLSVEGAGNLAPKARRMENGKRLRCRARARRIRRRKARARCLHARRNRHRRTR